MIFGWTNHQHLRPPGCCSAGALTTTTISQCFSWKQCSKINWHKSHKLWQIHANTIEIWWNLPEHPYSFDISIYLRSTPETHPTIFAQRALKSWVSNKFLFEEQGNVQHAKELESVEKVWESFCIGAVRWKKITVVAQYVHLTITNTLPETNIAPENWPSEKETSIPTKLVYVLCRNRVHLLLLMVHASGESVDMKKYPKWIQPFFQPMPTGLDSMPPSNRMTSGKQILKLSATYLTTWFSSWWLNQSIWKMCVRQIGNHFPQNRGEILK